MESVGVELIFCCLATIVIAFKAVASNLEKKTIYSVKIASNEEVFLAKQLSIDENVGVR